ncbi:hypothetical protein F511_37727 [Dorcoceras hygrometricum]|uniref:Secreted protein n=1 Tax=Dorcoceras hygrometricum TaxID=472368 RepID=A0A2Z7AD66_9LAMI|nr:hypothetical protein F511_37727 [Dorcoceras hygrometricum]
MHVLTYQLLVVLLARAVGSWCLLRRRFDKWERCRFVAFSCDCCLVVAADFTKRKEKIAADRLLLNTSMDLSESAGED